MISDFHQLAEKVTRLAEMADALRRENAELRLSVAGLSAENAELSGRIEEAWRRVAALLDKLPATDGEKEEQHDPA
jgi:cell division protein ZapB